MSFIFAIIGLGAAVVSSYMYGYAKGFNIGTKYPTLENGLGNVLKWVNEDDIPPTNMEEDYIFIHECKEPGCKTKVEFDDEPKCFTHSPDEGSSLLGYSARREAESEIPEF